MTMFRRKRFAVISLVVVLMWSSAKSTTQTDKKGAPYNSNHNGLSGEANAVLSGVFVLAVCGTFYLCISWTCCFEHEMFYSGEEGCGPCCSSDKMEKDFGGNTENTSVHLTENTVDAM